MVSKYAIFVIRRLIGSLIAVFAIATFNFFLFRVLPGNPIELLFRSPTLTPQQIRALEEQFGLNKPMLQQFVIYLYNFFTGNYGISFYYRVPVINVLIPRLVNSLILLLPASLAAIAFGIFTGMYAAWKRGTKVDVSILTSAMGLYSLPSFWVGGLLILCSLFYLKLPVSGMFTYGSVYPDVWTYLEDFLKHFILPFITLTLITYGEFTIIIRNCMVDVLTEDYIKLAIAQGTPTLRLLSRNALKNAMLPTISIIAINLGLIVAGAVLTETVFAWPGVGRLIYEAIIHRDYPILQGAFIIITISVVAANFIADMLYGYLDPRVRH